MRKCFLTLLTIFSFLSLSSLFVQSTAQANEIEFELTGKLGGTSNYIDKESLGDSVFNVSGGLNVDVLFRFDAGVGIGINFNWTMIEQRLDASKLTYALKATDRWQTVQIPSVGIVLRYQPNEYFDAGLWLNYGFGSVEMKLKLNEAIIANAYNLRGANFEWDMQTFEIGLSGLFTWAIPADVDLSIILGAQVYADFSAMYADDSTLDRARDIHGRRLDENSIYSIGFSFVFGLRYDLFFDK